MFGRIYPLVLWIGAYLVLLAVAAFVPVATEWVLRALLVLLFMLPIGAAIANA